MTSTDLPTDITALFQSLEAGTSISRAVLSKDGSKTAGPYITANSEAGDAFSDYQSNEVDALFNDRPAYQAILKESPRHRLILWMTANGQSPSQIAQALGCTKQTVYTTRKQPWFREMFVRLTSQMGKDSVTTFLQGEVMPSLEVLRDIRDNENAKSADRRAAADSLLDRYLGKATVKVDSTAKAPADVPTEADELLLEQARLAKELEARGLKPTTIN